MAVVTTRLATIDGIGFVDITYDDTEAVGGDLSACDLISVRVVVEAGRTGKVLFLRGGGQSWQERSATGPLDEIFSSGGPVKTVGDLGMMVFGGDE